MAYDYWHPYASEGIYHIYHRSPHNKNLFNDADDYNFFLSRFQKYFSICFDTYAYCLMPNHYHFLVEVLIETDIKTALVLLEKTNTITSFLNGKCVLNELIEDQFRRFHSSYALTFNRKYQSRGQVFMNRHKRIIEKDESKAEHIFCYIHHNPIHHNFCKDYGEWQHCSYSDYLNNNGSIINLKAGVKFMGGMQRFHEVHDQFKMEKMRDKQEFMEDLWDS